jgi:hypothetical protein
MWRETDSSDNIRVDVYRQFASGAINMYMYVKHEKHIKMTGPNKLRNRNTHYIEYHPCLSRPVFLSPADDVI